MIQRQAVDWQPPTCSQRVMVPVGGSSFRHARKNMQKDEFDMRPIDFNDASMQQKSFFLMLQPRSCCGYGLRYSFDFRANSKNNLLTWKRPDIIYPRSCTSSLTGGCVLSHAWRCASWSLRRSVTWNGGGCKSMSSSPSVPRNPLYRKRWFSPRGPSRNSFRNWVGLVDFLLNQPNI